MVPIVVSVDPRLFPSSSSLSGSSSITVNVPQDSRHPICDVKRHLHSVLSIPPPLQRLHSTGGGVDFIQNPSALRLSVRAARRETFPLCIRTFSESRMDERWTLKFDVDDTILDVKFIVAEAIRGKAEHIRLYVWRKGNPVRQQLEDTLTVGKAGLTEGQIVRFGLEIPSGVVGHGDVHRTRPELLMEEFPGTSTIAHLWKRAVKVGGNRRYLGVRKVNADGSRGEYEWQSFNEVEKRVDNFVSGMTSLGIRKGDRIGIISNNRPEYSVLDNAASLQGWVTVPLYDTLGPEAVTYILNHSECVAVIASANQLKSIAAAKPKCPLVKIVIAIDSIQSERDAIEKHKGVATYLFSQIESIGASYGKVPDNLPHPDDVFTICYTSGTTGNPKGAIITHRNMVATSAGFGDRFPPHLETPDDILFSYLPMAHIYERALEINSLRRSSAIGFSQGDNTKLVEDVTLLRPTVFPGVPRVWQRIFDRISAQVEESNFISRALFHRAFDSRLAQLRNGDFAGSIWDRIVFQKLANRFGGRLTFMTSGAAPLSSKIADFLRICFKTNFLEGYGLTESCAACTSTPMENFTYGIVGTPLACCDVKLVDVDDMGYKSSDKPHPRGEVWIRGPNVFKGYYKLPEQTAEVLSPDGWLATGDVGMWLPDGNLKIIDRKKNLFKLAQGEYIRPEHIEGVLKQNKFVANCYVHGDSLQNFLVAIVVPDFESLTGWAQSVPQLKSISGNPKALVVDKRVQAFIQQQIDDVSKAEGLKGFEMVKKIHLIAEDFSSDNGLLTPTMKLKRNVAAKTFAKQIAEMYAGGEGTAKEGEKAKEDKNKQIKSKL